MDNLVDACFCKHDIDLLKGMGLKAPSEVNNGDEIAMHDAAEKQFRRVRGYKGKAIQNGEKVISEDADIIMNLLRVYMGVMKPKKSRNNKISSSGEFGDLVIHLPGLLSNGVMKVFSNGKKVLDEAVDQDTIDLLMKRLDKKKNYSYLSNRIFDKLIQLNDAVEYDADDESDEGVDTRTPYYKSLLKNLEEEEPEERYIDGKPESEFFAECEETIRQCQERYDGDHETDSEEETEDGEFDEDEQREISKLVKRLETLCVDILDGDLTNKTRDEFTIIVNKLYEKGVVDDNQREQLYVKYYL